MDTNVKVYIRDGSWSAYVVRTDAFNKFTVSVTPESMDPEIYEAGPMAYAQKFQEDGDTVQIFDLREAA